MLAAKLGAVGPIEIARVEEGSNRRTHYVAVDGHGNRYGIKAISNHRSRVTGRLFTAEHIKSLAELTQILEMPVPVETTVISQIEGLDLEGFDAVLRKWHGVRLDKLEWQSRSWLLENPASFLRQYGQWLAFGLLFGLCDGKARNWSWCQETRTLGRFDLECSFYEVVEASDLSDGLRELGIRKDVRAGEEFATSQLSEGIDRAFRSFCDRKDAVQEVIERNEFSTAFMRQCRWKDMHPSTFLDAVLRGL